MPQYSHFLITEKKKFFFKVLSNTKNTPKSKKCLVEPILLFSENGGNQKITVLHFFYSQVSLFSFIMKGVKLGTST